MSSQEAMLFPHVHGHPDNWHMQVCETGTDEHIALLGAHTSRFVCEVVDSRQEANLGDVFEDFNRCKDRLGLSDT